MLGGVVEGGEEVEGTGITGEGGAHHLLGADTNVVCNSYIVSDVNYHHMYLVFTKTFQCYSNLVDFKVSNFHDYQVSIFRFLK